MVNLKKMSSHSCARFVAYSCPSLRELAFIKNKDVRILTYYPGELFGRMLEIQEKFKKEKVNVPHLKYQVRVWTSDLILMTKTTSDQTKWEETDVHKYGEISELKINLLSAHGSWDSSSPPKEVREVSEWKFSSGQSCKAKDGSTCLPGTWWLSKLIYIL